MLVRPDRSVSCAEDLEMLSRFCLSRASFWARCVSTTEAPVAAVARTADRRAYAGLLALAMFFDATAACNDNCRQADLGGWPEAWTHPPSANAAAWDGNNGYGARHQGGANYTFADGHVKFYKVEAIRGQAFDTTLVNGVQRNRTGTTPTFWPH